MAMIGKSADIFFWFSNQVAKITMDSIMELQRFAIPDTLE
jgi:hypothetical protein